MKRKLTLPLLSILSAASLAGLATSVISCDNLDTKDNSSNGSQNGSDNGSQNGSDKNDNNSSSNNNINNSGSTIGNNGSGSSNNNGSSSVGGNDAPVSKEFESKVNDFYRKINIRPKAKYASRFANYEQWPIDNFTSQYFDGMPSNNTRSASDIVLGISKIKSYNELDGTIDIELVFQSREHLNEFARRDLKIRGFAKETIKSVIDRNYSNENIVITPSDNVTADQILAINSNWDKSKIKDSNFYGLPKNIKGVEPELVEVICNDSELGQLNLKYNFHYENRIITTKTYTVSGFAIEDFNDKVERLYGDTKIIAREGAKQFSAIKGVWSNDKINNGWFEGLPKKLEEVNVNVKRVITNQDYESEGIIQIVYEFSKGINKIEKTYTVDGLYKDPTVAASNLYVAAKQLQNIKLKESIDASKIKLKDIANKDQKVMSKLFDLPKIAYVSYDYDVITWRNWKETGEKLPAGSFKLKFNIKDNINGGTKSVTSKLFYGFEDVLGKWNERFVYNNVFQALAAKDDVISWRDYYTGKGKGGKWDYSYDGILPATGQQNSVWIPLFAPNLPDTGNNNTANKAEFEKMNKLLEKRKDDLKKVDNLQSAIDDMKHVLLKREEILIPDDSFIAKRNHELIDKLFQKCKETGNINEGIHLWWKEQYKDLSHVMDNPTKINQVLEDIVKATFSSKYDHKYIEAFNNIDRRINEFAESSNNLHKTFWAEIDKITNEIPPLIEGNIVLPDGSISQWQIKDLVTAFDKVNEKIDKYTNSNVVPQIDALTTFLSILGEQLLDMLIPIPIVLVPIMQSKSYLPVLADIEGQYRYTKGTALGDAKHAFGYVNPEKSRYDKMVTHDLKDFNSLTWNDYVSKSSKGVIEALRKYLLKNTNFFKKEDTELKFDNIKYVSYQGTDNDYLKLSNGFEYSMGHTDAYWFMSHYVFSVEYDGETLEIPFTMRLGTLDGLEQDSDFVIGDDRDLELRYNVWKGDK